MANYYQNVNFNGLGTFSFNAPETSAFEIDGKISLPTIVGGNGPSSLVVTIKQNGTTMYTGLPGAEGFFVQISCTFNDLIQIIFSSSAAIDATLNAVKSTIAISEGVA